MDSKTPELTLYKIMLHGERSQEPHMEAELVLKIAAESHEAAERIVKDSLPGFDWSWKSLWGITPVSEHALIDPYEKAIAQDVKPA